MKVRQCPYVDKRISALCGSVSCSPRECIQFVRRVIAPGKCKFDNTDHDGEQHTCMNFKTREYLKEAVHFSRCKNCAFWTEKTTNRGEDKHEPRP